MSWRNNDLPAIRIAGRSIGGNSPCLIVAEIGTSHSGDIGKAKELIHAAVESGADCVKFQAVFAEEIVHPTAGSIDLPAGKIPIYDRFRAVESDVSFYREAKEYAESISAFFLCSPFGIKSAKLLKEIGTAAVKIASPEINHLPLLDLRSEWGVPCIVSTGVSFLGDIELAVRRLKGPTALLHCVTSYPAPPVDYNLKIIPNLKNIFGVPVGVSDHSLDPEIIPALAVYLGASIVEKHLTLSKLGGGLDDPIALTPDEFGGMTRAIRNTESDPEGSFQDLRDRFDSIEEILGDGVKRLGSNELAIYRTTNRSILATKHIDQNERFTGGNTALLRSETNLVPGLEPRFYSMILGRCAARAVESGTGIHWEDVGASANAASAIPASPKPDR